MVIDCDKGFESLISAAQRAYISSIHFVLSRKAWDDPQRHDQNQHGLNNASEFLHKVRDHSNEFVVLDRDTADSLKLCRDAMVELGWLSAEESYSPMFGQRVEECRDIVDDFRDQLSRKYSGDNTKIEIEENLLRIPSELFSKMYDVLTTRMLSERQGCW